MAISRNLVPLLPELRRFSAALNGSVESGDANVIAALESLVQEPALVQQPGALSRGLPLRVALYRALLAHAPRESRPLLDRAGRPGLELNLASLTPELRQAFLLTSVERFSTAETAAIMGVDGDRVTALRRRAAREIARRLASRILIIEDERALAEDLASILGDLGHEVIVAHGDRHAVALAAERKPKLILADLELAGGASGLKAINGVLRLADRAVVLLAARSIRRESAEDWPRRAVVLHKPFSRATVTAAVSRALFLDLRARAA